MNLSKDGYIDFKFKGSNNKFLFASENDFISFINSDCIDNNHYKFKINNPKKYPCVGIMKFIPSDCCYCWWVMIDYVYKEDFKL